jgi:hypothetical protein
MKRIFKITPVALAVAAVFASPVQAEGNDSNHRGPYSLTNRASVDLDTEWDIRNDVTVWGGAFVRGVINVEAESAAVVDGKQLNYGNKVTNDHNTNNAVVDGNAMQGASGNIGLNVTAGSNNQQANEAALSAVDADFVFASAQNFSLQSAAGNPTTNLGVTNNAFLIGSALAGASGNIGVNIAAGSSNQQRNELSASVNTGGSMAKASTWGVQESMNNSVTNDPLSHTITNNVNVTVSGLMSGGYAGGGIGGYAGRASGSTSGTADQIGNVYPDIWAPPGGHPTPGAYLGHLDLDTQTQGGSDLNGDGGSLAFREQGTYSGSESGRLGFYEAGVIVLGGTLTGNVTYTQTIYRDTVNNAVLGGNALQGASGNIGVNIAAGSTNQQRNSLAIAAGLGRSGGGGGGVE